MVLMCLETAPAFAFKGLMASLGLLSWDKVGQGGKEI
jgi:hypothetical protein